MAAVSQVPGRERDVFANSTSALGVGDKEDDSGATVGGVSGFSLPHNGTPPTLVTMSVLPY